MFNLLQKYSSKLVIFTLCSIFILSCVHKSKYEKKQKLLSDAKMITVLEDVVLMESYVNEKLPSATIDTLSALKSNFYNQIFKKHKIDSASFYSTLYYFQVHPIEFDSLLVKIDDKLSLVKPKDTTIVKPIVKIESSGLPTGNVIDQEKEMKEEYKKRFPKLFNNRNRDSI